MGHPILRNMVLKTPDYLAPCEFLFLEERGNPALCPYPHRETPKSSLSAPAQFPALFQFPGERWLETGPSDTSLNRREVKEFSSILQWVIVNLLGFINRQSFHLTQSEAVFLSDEWNPSRPGFSNYGPT